MNEPIRLPNVTIDMDTVVLSSYLPVPGYGVLPVNAFVIRGREPVLIDTGLAALHADFVAALGEVIDPADLRWIWMTHADPDHTGGLAHALEAAPHARLVTNYLGMAKLGLLGFPVDRAFLINPGQSLDIGDRKLRALRPPTFDAPETMAIFDPSSRTLFSSDSFGALLEKPQETANEIDRKALEEGLTLWASVDAPWLRLVDESRYGAALAEIADLSAHHVLSSHLPPAENMTSWLLEQLAAARRAPTFVGPDQAAFARLLAAA